MRKKILKIGIDGRLWGATGVGRYIRNLVSELQKIPSKNIYVIFVLQKDIKTVSQIIRKPNWVIKPINISWHSFAEQLLFPWIIYKENIDVMHFPYFSMPILYRKPYVLTIHDLIINHFPTGQASTLPNWYYQVKVKVYEYILRKTASHAQKILAVSYATKNEILDHLPVSSDKVIVTYEGIDKNISISTKHTPFSHKYFLYVGNAYPHKNIIRLLQAFKRFKEKDKKNMILVLVGPEDFFYKRLKNYVMDIKLDQHIRFLHQVNDHELAQLYEYTSGVIVPSLMEGFGLPALEAMSHKSLVIASKIPSLEEVCGNAALYMNPLKIDDMVKAITKAAQLSSKEKEKYSKIGQEKAKEFSWEKMALETKGVYESCNSL